MATLLSQSRTADIRLVEDNNNDVERMDIAFKRAKFAVNLNHVANGEECMVLLRKEGECAAAPPPDLVLLDPNMSRMDGRAVLEVIARDKRLQYLPIVILTTSEVPNDVLISCMLARQLLHRQASGRRAVLKGGPRNCRILVRSGGLASGAALIDCKRQRGSADGSGAGRQNQCS